MLFCVLNFNFSFSDYKRILIGKAIKSAENISDLKGLSGF